MARRKIEGGTVRVGGLNVGSWAYMSANMVRASAWFVVNREEPRDCYAADHLIPDPDLPRGPKTVVPLGLFPTAREAQAAILAAEETRRADPAGAYRHAYETRVLPFLRTLFRDAK